MYSICVVKVGSMLWGRILMAKKRSVKNQQSVNNYKYAKIATLTVVSMNLSVL